MSKKDPHDDKNVIFYAKINKGFVPKVAIDAIVASDIARIPFALTENGITTCVADNEDVSKAHSMWNIVWERNQCSGYKCTKPLTVMFTGKHARSNLKNIKKKESMALFIRKNDMTRLTIDIEPNVPTNDPAARSENIYLSIQIVDDTPIILPDSQEAYDHPMVIPASGFQGVKNLTNMCKTIIIIIQKSCYVSFRSGDVKIVAKNINFGILAGGVAKKKKKNTEPIQCEYGPEIGEILETYPNVHVQKYDASLLQPLLKLPGLCNQMSFCAPKDPRFPLKVTMRASSGLGDVAYYFKNQDQIAAMEEQ